MLSAATSAYQVQPDPTSHTDAFRDMQYTFK